MKFGTWRCWNRFMVHNHYSVGWSSPTQQQSLSPKNWINIKCISEIWSAPKLIGPKKKKKETQRYDLLQSFYRSIYLCQNSILLFPFNLYSDFFNHLILCTEHWQAWNIKTAKSWLFIQSELVLQLSSHNWKIKW